MFKCAIIGVSGGRAKGLAEAYQHIKRGQLVAVSTRQPDKLAEFGDRFAISARYTDYRELFDREKPDLVHVNTPPTVRLEIFEAAEAAGIPAILVEKPLAVQGEDYQAIRTFARHSRVKIAINHQLHFHPRRQALQQFVQEGKIGAVRFIEASAGMNLAYQGTHSLQAISAFNPEAKPISVYAQVSGTAGLQATPKKHFAPDQCLASISYDNGISAILRCGHNAPRVTDGPVHQHKRVAVYGTRGFVQWTMWSWETSSDGQIEGGSHNYANEDILGQAAMTEAMFDWLDSDWNTHPLNLKTALSDFNIILGIYSSALHHQVVELPIKPEGELIAKLRRQLLEKV
jgi:predicted dehydrogenase